MWSADEIARICFECFSELPKRGKPELGREWTLLAAVVKVSESQSPDQPERNRIEKEVVSLGTGTKCIGKSAMSPHGDVLNDSHAEVIARRGFVRYLTEQLRRAVFGESSSVFRPGDERGKWRLKDGVSFLFFTSHTPCGDASIIPMTDSQSQPCLPVRTEEHTDETNNRPVEKHRGRTLKRQMEREGEEGAACKHLRLAIEEEDGQACLVSETLPEENPTSPKNEVADPDGRGRRSLEEQTLDIHRTGAKCVPGAPTDPHLAGPGYHTVGVLRVKPGRGDPTLSLSCSDKMARWTALGCQGALLSHYLQEAIYFSAVITGKCPYSLPAMQRALTNRSLICKAELFRCFLDLLAVTADSELPQSLRVDDSADNVENNGILSKRVAQVYRCPTKR
ncbi:hypothetical protein JZ751_027089 [Albula glossodonta]|uniref:tRNA-specific adenosine deaminase 1 n=1 Tax=Albula glossodonta TaxID=121402 RepID=A0A8T2NKL0_9TELE|nr:hypothetical protein JZ751_027089 [Albula glossodonta]